jgi:hypothetical protein
LAQPRWPLPLAAQGEDDPTGQEQHREGAGRTNEVHDDETVLAGLRIVVVAEQQHLIGERADLARRGLDERQLQVARREFHAVQVPRHMARRGQHRDRRRVRELVDRGVIGVTEADGAGQRLDR